VPGFRRFLIFYRVTENTLEVIRVLHSARDVVRVLRRTQRSRLYQARFVALRLAG